MKHISTLLASLLLLIHAVSAAAGPPALKESVSEPEDFPIVLEGRAAPILIDSQDADVVRIVGGLLAEDIERVSGVRPKLSSGLDDHAGLVILLGTLGKSPLIDALIEQGTLDAGDLRGKWESYVVTTVTAPLPGVAKALVIAGSDRRGTAYGAFEVSEAVGVSPWVWWADVRPRQRETLVISADGHKQGPPSVMYRGIFINDEDWGLQPWAEKTFEPETGGIGPKTYAKVCELLLRLKANFMWPAMHPSTRAFNHYPDNKIVADRYAIVMGSSHAEPMLRNNVDEWDKREYGDWNPVTNLGGVLRYWEERVRENGAFENVYTVGMRGIHDSGMPGGGSREDKRERLEKIMGLQRDMLAKHVNADISQVPQIFCPYKEVLEIYQSGMDVPDEVTMVWPDDNHGYLRQLPNAQERERSGGHGVYYHLSYWGRPHDYLWLDSTSPALIWHEMTKAYQLGARRLWVVNVGDIKPIETGMSLFLRLAWNIDSYGPDVQQAFLKDFYAQQFGSAPSDRIARVRDEYYRLCAIRRPEHMGFNRISPNTPVQNVDWSSEEADRVLHRWQALAKATRGIGEELPKRSSDAFFQLVEYPALAGAAMAEKILLAQRARETGAADAARQSKAAYQQIQRLTQRYNRLNDGKWRTMMVYGPRRLPVYGMPPTEPASQQAQSETSDQAAGDNATLRIDPTEFTNSRDVGGVGWRVIEGLGPRGSAIVVLPRRDTPTLHSPQQIRDEAPMVEYDLSGMPSGVVEVTIDALPTHPFTPDHQGVAAVSIDDGDPVLVEFVQGRNNEHDRTWQTNVLRGAMFGTASLKASSSHSRLKLWAADRGLVVQGIAVAKAKQE